MSSVAALLIEMIGSIQELLKLIWGSHWKTFEAPQKPGQKYDISPQKIASVKQQEGRYGIKNEGRALFRKGNKAGG